MLLAFSQNEWSADGRHCVARMTGDHQRVSFCDSNSVAPTQESLREVFREIAETSYHEWPAYDATPLYDRSSLGGIEEDIRTVDQFQ